LGFPRPPGPASVFARSIRRSIRKSANYTRILPVGTSQTGAVYILVKNNSSLGSLGQSNQKGFDPCSVAVLRSFLGFGIWPHKLPTLNQACCLTLSRALTMDTCLQPLNISCSRKCISELIFSCNCQH